MGRNSSGFKSRKSEKRTEISVFRVFLAAEFLEFPLAVAQRANLKRVTFWGSKGEKTCRVLSQRLMQWKWKAWLHTPQATLHSSEVAEDWLAWHSMQRSLKILKRVEIPYSPMMWFRQMAQLSTTMSHAQSATAFHFFTSKRFFSVAVSTSILK